VLEGTETALSCLCVLCGDKLICFMVSQEGFQKCMAIMDEIGITFNEKKEKMLGRFN
jgi:hypothetical protein